MPSTNGDIEGMLCVMCIDGEVKSMTDGVVAFESSSESDMLISTGNRRGSPADEFATEGPATLEGESVSPRVAVESARRGESFEESCCEIPWNIT